MSKRKRREASKIRKWHAPIFLLLFIVVGTFGAILLSFLKVGEGVGTFGRIKSPEVLTVTMHGNSYEFAFDHETIVSGERGDEKLSDLTKGSKIHIKYRGQVFSKPYIFQIKIMALNQESDHTHQHHQLGK